MTKVTSNFFGDDCDTFRMLTNTYRPTIIPSYPNARCPPLGTQRCGALAASRSTKACSRGEKQINVWRVAWVEHRLITSSRHTTCITNHNLPQKIFENNIMFKNRLNYSNLIIKDQEG